MPLLRSAQSQYIAISFVDHDHFAVRWKSDVYRIADLAEKLLRAILPEGHLNSFAGVAPHPVQRLSRQRVIVQH